MKNSNVMTDHVELKRAAEAASQGRWNQDGFDVQNDDIEDYRVSRCNLLADAKFIAAANPAAVLALISENERLRVDLKSVVRLNNENADLFKAKNDQLKAENERQAAQFKEWQASHHANYCKVAEDRDELRAENAGLKTGYEAYERVNAELKAEVEGLRKALADILDLYDTDEGCRSLPQYIVGRAALGQGEQS